jgi:hypothetical protein
MATTLRPRRRAVRHPVALHALLYPDSGQVLAHALEVDIASQGDTAQQALAGLQDALVALFEVVAEDDDARSPFETPAPSAFWRALRGAQLTSSVRLRLAGCGEATVLAYRADEAPEA